MKLFCVTIIIFFYAGCSPAKKTTAPVVTKVKENRVTETITTKSSGGKTGNSISAIMNMQADAIKNAIKNISVQKIGEGIDITFDEQPENILLFAPGSSTLSSTGKESLNELFKIFKEIKDTDIRIESHTDDAGASSANMLLSERRANAVGEYFKAKGISPHRLMIRWFGESQPKVKGTTTLARSKNRRTEIVVTANDVMKTAFKRSR